MKTGTKRTVALVCALLALAILGYWAITSREIVTKNAQLVEITEKDEVFGTTTTRQEWRPAFLLGLEYTAAAVAPLLLIAGAFAWSARRGARRAAASP